MTFNHYKMKELISDISMGPFGSNIKTDCYQESGVPYLNGSNLMGITLVEDKFNYISEEKANELGRAVAQRGDVIVTHRGTLGQISYIPLTSKYKRYVTGNSQFRFSCNMLLLPEYIVYYFHSRKGQHTLLSNSSRVGVPALARPTSSFQTLDVEIPDVDTQKRIVKILSSLDNKIELNNKINANLQQQAQALFKSWFVDFEPWGGELPSVWEKTDIYSIAHIIYGAPFKSSLFNTSKEGRPVIRIRDLKNQHTDIYTTEVHPKEYIIKNGDIVVGMDGEFKPYLWGGIENALLNQRVCIFSNKRPMGKFFLYLSIMPLLDKVEKTEVATTVIHIGKSDFDSFEITLPDEETLNKFDAITYPIWQEIVTLKRENRRLAELRDTLLPKLMSGELDVSDVELSEVSDA